MSIKHGDTPQNDLLRVQVNLRISSPDFGVGEAETFDRTGISIIEKGIANKRPVSADKKVV